MRSCLAHGLSRGVISNGSLSDLNSKRGNPGKGSRYPHADESYVSSTCKSTRSHSSCASLRCSCSCHRGGKK